MIEAWVLVQTEPGARAAEASRRFREIPGVVSADDVSGPYDVIARVAVDDLGALGELVVGRMQQVEGVVRTLTCPVVRL